VSFNWLNGFQQGMKKPADYAEKTLAAYKLGMKARGSIIGVRVIIDPDGCEQCKALDADAIYDPVDAPRLPLPQCDRVDNCQCVYRPLMSYQVEDET
jgi:hypothetical protein